MGTSAHSFLRWLGAASLFACPASALAGTFVVDTTADGGPGSLRQAILDANASAGTDAIAFAIPGAGPHAIAPATALPDVTDRLVIDGFSQAGAGVHAVVLSGAAIPAASCLRLVAGADGSTISGLVVNGFQFQIQLVGSHENAIYGCYLGLDATGTVAVGRPRAGVLLQGSQRNTIGAPGMGNVITANSSAAGGRQAVGVWLQAGSNDNVVQANRCGTDKDGTFGVGAPFSGVQIAGGVTGNLIGGHGAGEGNVLSNGTDGIGMNGKLNDIIGNYMGTDATGTYAIPNDYGIFFSTSLLVLNPNVTGNVIEGNLISGNHFPGVAIANGASGNIIRRNFVGTDVTGTLPLGNGFNVDGSRFAGVGMVIDATNNRVEENLIAFNGAQGVFVNQSFDGIPASAGNTILGNSIHSNGTQGIDLSNRTDFPPLTEGPTLNDLLDLDLGANHLQNFPVLSPRSFRNPAQAQVWGSLDSTPNTPFRIEVFTSRDARIVDVATESGPVPFLVAQGEAFGGAITVVTDADGHAEFQLGAGEQPPVGDYVTATATNLDTGDTSEFSEALRLGRVGGANAYGPR